MASTRPDERSLVDLRVQRGEEEVLQHGAVVVCRVGRVVLEGRGGERLREDVLWHEALLFEEPDEQQARDQPDHLPFKAAIALAVVGEAALDERSLKPLKQLSIETPVELLGVQCVFPRPMQVVEGGDALGLHKAGQRQLRQDDQMGAVRGTHVHILHESHPFQHVAVAVATVGAAMDHG